MNKRVNFQNLDFSAFDHASLIMALTAQRDVKRQLLSYYEDNPHEYVVTPVEALRQDAEALDRLLLVFRHGGTYESN